MHEAITFPVGHCASCARDVLIGHDLDASDEVIAVCTRCGSPLGEATVRRYSASSVSAMGYEFEGAGGCGAGGCGSCSTDNA